MNYYQLPIIIPSRKTLILLSECISTTLKAQNLNVIISNDKLYDLYTTLSQIPALGQDKTLIFEKTVEIAICNALNYITPVIKTYYKTTIIKSGLKSIKLNNSWNI
ncbi:hypothetical protein LCDV1gp078 [Lymphocystis disease virus 1]|uniref:hypothetical protein n=1 Tax=Fish lymphocystis disease virus TaxID=36363 RepID=UPI0000161EF9|nr:hypothetical protein LCDV1gp078 [Lymphocystis disease virus 1]